MDKLRVIKDGFLLEDEEYAFDGNILSLSMPNMDEGSHYINITITDKVNQITEFYFEFTYALVIPTSTTTSDSPTNSTTTTATITPTTSTASKETFSTVSERVNYLHGLYILPVMVLLHKRRRR